MMRLWPLQRNSNTRRVACVGIIRKERGFRPEPLGAHKEQGDKRTGTTVYDRG